MNNFDNAQAFVGNVGADYYTVGRLQLDLLKMNGCSPESHVLEVGCGCLVAGRPIIEFLLPDRYVGIEPNVWLLEAVKEGIPNINDLIARKRPIFLSSSDFDASNTHRQFDFVIAHSILSHAAHWQYPQFLKALKKVLRPTGIVIASLRFFNENGELMGDSKNEDWAYPGVSYFSWETIKAVAAECGYHVEWRKDYRQFFVKAAPSNYHDWIRLTLQRDATDVCDDAAAEESALAPGASCNVCGSSPLEQYRVRSDGVNVIRCPHCGMGVVEQQPADLNSLYDDAYYHAAAASEYGYSDYTYNAEFGVAWAASLIRLLAPHGRILDIGCADGHLLKKLQPSHDCYGIEVNSRMREVCRDAGILIISSDIYDPALGEYKEFFDVVSAIAVFEHLRDLKGAVKIALEFLKPHGVLLLEVPLISTNRPSDVWFKSSLEHIYYPDERSLHYLFETVFDVALIGSEVVVADYGSVFVGLVPKSRVRGDELARQYQKLLEAPFAELNKEERRFRFLLDCLHAANTDPGLLDLLRDFELSEISSPFFQRLVNLWRRDLERLAGVTTHLRSLDAIRNHQVEEAARLSERLAGVTTHLRSLDAIRNHQVEEAARLKEEIANLQAAQAARENDLGNLQAAIGAKDEVIRAQQEELQIFRTSKLQRLRSTLLYERLSGRKLIKVLYLLTALATPESARRRLRPFVHTWKRRLDATKHHARKLDAIEYSEPEVHRSIQKKWPEDRPLVSVVIPSFNYGRYLEETVDSILSQTFQDVEIIVSDGGSTDDETLRVLHSLRKPRTKVYLNRGRRLLGANRNCGIRRSRGKYICCLDSDDKLKPTYLEKALFLLETYNYDIVSTSVQCFGGSNALWKVPAKPSLEQLTRNNQFSVVAVFAKEMWKRARGYHDWGIGKDLVAEDWDLWVRMMALGARAINIPEALMLYRVHDASLSKQAEVRSWEEHRKKILQFNEKLLKRKNYLLSAKRNAAIVEVQNPYLNLVTSYQKAAKKPAILLALPFVITGGADTVFLDMAKHLKANGFDLSVVTTQPGDIRFGDNTAEYEAVTKQIYHLHQFLNNATAWKDFVFYLIETRRIDILLLAGSAYIYELLPELKQRFPRLKIVDHLFNEYGHIEKNRQFKGLIDIHIVVNEVIKSVLTNVYEEAEEKISVILPGVDVENKFNPAHSDGIETELDLRVPRGRFFVSFIGRFSEEKCPATFVQMANSLRDKDNLYFVMLGNGPEYDRVKEKIQELNLEDRIYAPGNVTDVRPYLKLSGVLVIPSTIEGIPVTLMESMAFGVPVIASAVGGIPSVIREEFNGFVCQPSDIDAFVRNIQRLATDESLLRRMKANAREYALQHFSVERTTREYCNLFRDLLDGKAIQAGAFATARMGR